MISYKLIQTEQNCEGSGQAQKVVSQWWEILRKSMQYELVGERKR